MSPEEQNMLFAQIQALRQQLPQWNSDAAWARDTSKVFGSHSPTGRANIEGMDQGLNLKEMEMERLQEILNQSRMRR